MKTTQNIRHEVDAIINRYANRWPGVNFSYRLEAQTAQVEMKLSQTVLGQTLNWTILSGYEDYYVQDAVRVTQAIDNAIEGFRRGLAISFRKSLPRELVPGVTIEMVGDHEVLTYEGERWVREKVTGVPVAFMKGGS